MFFNLPDFSNMDFANLNGGNNPYTDALAPPAVRSELAIPPEAQAAVNARRGANEARRGATDQYESDVADFRDIEASEAEQGLASLPDYIDAGSFGGRIQTRPGGSPTQGTPDLPAPTDPNNGFSMGTMGGPVYDDAGNLIGNLGSAGPLFGDEGGQEAPVNPYGDYDFSNIDMGSFGGNYLGSMGGNMFSGSTGEIAGNPYAERLLANAPVNNPPPPATDPDQYMGMGNDFTFGGPFQPGQYGNQTRPGGPPPPPEVLPPPPPAEFVHPYPDTDYRPVNYYTGERIDNAYQPRSTESGAAPLSRAIAPENFGQAPSSSRFPQPPGRPMEDINLPIDDRPPPPPQVMHPSTDELRNLIRDAGGLQNGGYVNQGISQLPINGQGDTLTQQVFQSGFRPRR
jgi:hypothetical protein